MIPLCNDTGNYTCAAENSEGKANQTKELFVLCSPRPVVSLLPKIAVGNDSILEINVIFFSYPQPKISWTFSKNGSNETVRSNDTIGIYQHISSIYITDMKTSQYGMYVLQVSNGIPNDFKHDFEVLPQRQPDIPTNFNASCDAPNYANLQWIPSFHGGDTQLFKLYYAVQDGQILFTKHRININENENELFTFERINGLQPATSYVFKLIAYNTFGDSNFIKAYCNTTKSALEKESNIGLYIGASIGTFAAVFSIAFSVVVLFLRRKKYQGKRSERNERGDQ
ncbi:nephrin-like [Mytilus galloprovincialis]|uniref:nephrin-like n=1 Tax=Mytilus galloprovincialis TaxID=29158 RepID=UPI003F7BB41D